MPTPERPMPPAEAEGREGLDPEYDEYPVPIAAYLMMETALARRILADQNARAVVVGERDRGSWEELGQTSHEGLWQLARGEAGLPTAWSWKNRLLRAALSAAPREGEPEEFDCPKCGVYIVDLMAALKKSLAAARAGEGDRT